LIVIIGGVYIYRKKRKSKKEEYSKEKLVN
jgi:hypothetical protein